MTQRDSLPRNWRQNYDQVPVQSKAKNQIDDVIIFKPMIFPIKTGRYLVYDYEQLHEICQKIKLEM